MRRLRDLMTGESKIRYLLWKALRLPINITIRLTSGERLNLRPLPFDDIETAYEIFVAQVYDSPLPIETDSVKQIVDLGANVGFSGIYLARRYPKAKIIAFEPHPLHAQLARRNLSLNGSQSLDLVCAAATARTGEAFLTNEGICSTVLSQQLPGSVPIRLLDVFEYLNDTPIDLLKIDIEGGEFSLLEDHRFANLSAKIIVLEYHILSERPDACNWCKQKLAEFGYRIEQGAWDGPENGLIWAYRDAVLS
jgi:FkbM family methyltransferase